MAKLIYDGIEVTGGGGSATELSFPVTAQTSVTITHTLGIDHPYIVCVDSDGNTLHPSVEYISTTQFKLEFNTAFTGTVYIH